MSIAGCMSKNGFTSSQKADAVRQVKSFVDGGMTAKEAERSVARALLNQSLADRKYLHEAITPKLPKGATNVEPTAAVSQEVKGPSKQDQRRQATKQAAVPVSTQEVTSPPKKDTPAPAPAPLDLKAEMAAAAAELGVTPATKKTQETEAAKRDTPKAPRVSKEDASVGNASSEYKGGDASRAEHIYALAKKAELATESEAADLRDAASAAYKDGGPEFAKFFETYVPSKIRPLNQFVTEEFAAPAEASGFENIPQSINPAEITKPSSKGRIVAALNAISPNWQGKVKIFSTAAEVPAELQHHFTNPRTAARYIPADGKGGGGFAIMVADRIQQGSEKGVFLHEIGVHAAMPMGVIKRLATDIRAWAKDGNRGLLEQMWANRVVAEVQKNNLDRIARGEPAMTEDLRAHEEVALFVQRLSEAGIDPVQPEGVSAGLAAWLKDLVAQFRSMLAKAMNTSVKLTGQDIVTLANAAAAQVSQQGVMGNKAEAFNGEAPASTNSEAVENPDSPVSKAISKGIKDVLINRTTREAGLGWLSLHGLVDMYAPPESTGWRGALRKLRDKMVTQDGFMNSLKVKSNLIAGQFNEFEKSATNYSDFYSLMLRTTETGVDPRLKLSDKPGSLLLPLKEQNAYKKAVADVEVAQAKSDKFGPEAKQHLDDLADAKRILAAVKKDYAGVLDKYSKMTPEEQAAFVKTYKDVEAEWRKWGNVAGAKNPKIAHELYNNAERHLKALGQQQIDTLVGSWYDISYSDKFVYPDGTILNDKGDPLSAKQIADGATGTNVSGKPVPRATTLSEMMHQMRNGYAGKAALEFMTNKVDPTLMRMHQGPYFHMARWGDYWVTYKSGKEMHREHFENKAEWDEAVAHIREMGEKGEIDKETIDVGLKAQETTKAMSMPMLKNMITAAEAQINAQVGVSDETKETQVKLMRDTLARAYIDTLPETSSKTMQQLRRNVKGASIDMKRSFAKRAEAAHINIAMAKYMPEINLITREMELAAKSLGKEGGSTDEIEIARNVVDEIKQRQNDLANQPGGKTWRENLMSLNHFWYLAGNIKYNVANLMQPLQFVGVIGGKFGMVSAGRALAQAYPGAVQIFNEARKVSWTNPHLDFSKHLADAEAGQKPLGLGLGQWRMLNALNKQGKLDFTLARELGAISDQEAFNEKTFAGRSANNANRVGKALSVAGHHSETINRSATALAAYNLFMEKNAKMADKAKLQENAKAYAQHAVDKTHFDYSGINTARQMGRNGIFGKNTPLVMAFKRFGAQQLELYLDTVRRSIGHDRARRLAELEKNNSQLSKADQKAAVDKFNESEDQFEKEARAQLRGMLGMTAILAGAMGLPMATVVAAAFNAGPGGDDEDVRNKWRRYAAEYFGKYGGGIVTNGIFHGAGVDLQSSIGAQDLIPFSRFFADRREFKDKVQSLASDSAGAAAGMAESVIGSVGKVMDGDIGGAMTDALPKAAANILKGAKLGSDGFYRDAKGNKLPGETSDISAVLTMMGFTTSEMEERGAADRYLKSKQYIQGKEVALIHKDYNSARDSQDREGAREAMKALRDYNLEHPDARVPMQSLVNSYISMRKKQIVAERTGTGILTSARKARETENDAGWVNWGNE